jgi:hypothetical protein
MPARHGHGEARKAASSRRQADPIAIWQIQAAVRAVESALEHAVTYSDVWLGVLTCQSGSSVDAAPLRAICCWLAQHRRLREVPYQP